jgi:hypothetical protein
MGMGWNDWQPWALLIATILILAFIMLKGRHRKRLGRRSDSGRTAGAETFGVGDFSWGPGLRSHAGFGNYNHFFHLKNR